MNLLDGGWRRRWEDARLPELGGAARRMAVSMGRTAVDALFPPTAWDAAEPAGSSGLTADGFSRATFLEAPVCDGCGAGFEFDGGAFAADRCAACLARPYAFQRARAACVYDDASRDLILKFKHGDRHEHGPLFARWISRAAADLIEDADAIAPVPLHPFRLMSRRFNQAAEIARPLARMSRLAYLPDAMVRAKRTDSQGGKSARGRRLNVRAAFSVTEAGRKQVKGRHILLIDDVLTTGATAEACTRALMAAGARAVDLAVVARVRTARTLE